MTKSRVVSTKPWWKSKTIRVNVLAAVLIALEAQFNVLQPFLPGNVYAWFTVALTAVNTALRIITVAPVTLGSGEQQ